MVDMAPRTPYLKHGGGGGGGGGRRQVLRGAQTRPAAGPDDPGFGAASVRDAVARVVDLLDPADPTRLRARLAARADDPAARAEALAGGELAALAAAVEGLSASIAAAKGGGGSGSGGGPAADPAELTVLAGADGARLEEMAAAAAAAIAAAVGRPEERSRAVRETLVTDAVERLDALDVVMDRWGSQ